MIPQRLRVFGLSPNAWNWVPPSLKTERDLKARGCRCNGTGNLGYVEDTHNGVMVSRALPCPCLVAVIDDDNFQKVNREVDNHFLNIKTEGQFCRCLFCEKRRALNLDKVAEPA